MMGIPLSRVPPEAANLADACRDLLVELSKDEEKVRRYGDAPSVRVDWDRFQDLAFMVRKGFHTGGGTNRENSSEKQSA